MFAKTKKVNKTKSNSDGKNRSLAQLGLLNIPNVPNSLMDENGEDDDDDDLEAELDALISETPHAKPPPRRKPEMNNKKMEEMLDPHMEIGVSDGDDDEVDENDPDLLSELQGLASEENEEIDQLETPSTNRESAVNNQISSVELQSRLESYLAAEKAAKSSNNSSKARRYNRAAKTLNEQIKMINAGKHIPEEEIPPALPTIVPRRPADQLPEQPQNVPLKPAALSTAESPASQTASFHEQTAAPNVKVEPAKNKDNSSMPQAMPPTKTEPSEAEKNHNILIERRDEYKKAALVAKSKNDKATAIKYIGIMKQFDSVISALDNGQPIDLSKMPPPPPTMVSEVHQPAPISSETQKSIAPTVSENNSTQFVAPAKPLSVLEALQERLEKFKATETSARQEGNNSKARRVGRIVKQYNVAIKDYKAGKTLDMEELPTPPGCPPIPKEGISVSASESSTHNQNDKKVENLPPSGEQRVISPTKKQPAPPIPSKSLATKPLPSKRPNLSNRTEKQLQFLLQRQKYFRSAALESKKEGDLELARNFLKTAKGIDPMIEATRSGLPVDLKTIPLPPQLKEDFEIIDLPVQEPTGDGAELYKTLEQDLRKQFKLCLTNKEMFTKLGDVSLASKFENFAVDTKRDIQVIQNNIKRNDPVPKFHYETRVFSVIKCNPSLNDNDMELTIIRGINLPGTKDLDTFVSFEFPLPSDDPQTNKTSTVKNTTEPEFNTTFMLNISRKSRATSRLFKRNALKIEVWSKGGFFSKDSLIGTIKAPLNILESKCELHTSLEIFNGRKACGGKLELKIRLKEPLLCKQVETLKERWLIIGS